MTKDLTSVYKKYKGKWVAMNDSFTEVLVSGKTSSFVFQKAKKMGYKVPNIFQVPSNLTAFVG